MPRSNHDRIIKIIYEFCKRNTKYKRVYADHIGEDFIPIVTHSEPAKGEKAETLSFNPDIWAERKRGGIDVFEVWHSESNAECISDIVFFALTRNRMHLHLICLNEYNYEFAKKLNKIILYQIHDNQGKYLYKEDPFTVLITNNIIKNEEKLRTFLFDKLRLRY